MLFVSESQSNAASSLATSKKAYQMSIQAGMEHVCQTDIRHSNNSILEMAIADFFHCENIPDCVVESVRFKQLLEKARYVGSDFKIPSRKKIGGKFFFLLSFIIILTNKLSGNLLDINFQAIYDSNKRLTTENAKWFGLSWIGDGATIKRMPLLNMLAMCGSKPPAVIAILDCTGHMVDGGKIDAEFIMSFFKAKVDEFDPGKTLTDTSFFDGAANVQKAGQYFVHTFHGQCVSMEENMSCHYL